MRNILVLYQLVGLHRHDMIIRRLVNLDIPYTRPEMSS
jgi:hypothetical protein